MAPLYAVLDAAIVFGLPERVDAERLEACCLFTGKAGRELADVAPWLVRLAEGDALLRDLATAGDEIWALWSRSPGIFLLSDLPTDALRRHLRRFLRVRDDGGRTFLFRFWEPDAAAAYLGAVADDHETTARWFHPLEGGRIDAILVPDTEGGVLVRHDAPPPDLHAVRTPFAIREPEVSALLRERRTRDVAGIAAVLAATFPDAAGAEPDLAATVEATVERMEARGIRQRDHLVRVAAWDLHLGGPFERADGDLARILADDADEADKMRRLSERLAAVRASPGAASGAAG